MRRNFWISQHLAALRALLVLTVLTGILYPLVITGVAQLPGLRDNANGSMLKSGDTTVGSAIIGQGFLDKDGNPLIQYFQSRPSAAGNGWDPTASGPSNLGPESTVDTLPAAGEPGKPSLLTQVCTRSHAVGRLEGVDGSRRYCTSNGVGAVLGVFYKNGATGPVTRVVSLNQACPATPFRRSYGGVRVECARSGADYAKAVVVPVRGGAPARPAVPADAVTASGSGLDPQISIEYARLQAPRVAKARDIDTSTVDKLIDKYTSGRALGFMGPPAVNVVRLNAALDQQHQYRAS